MREAARVLAPDGRYCIAIVHPLNTAGSFVSREPEAQFVIESSYFEHREKEMTVEREGLAMTFLDAHRPLEDYFRTLEEAGLAVERLREIPDTSEAEGGERWRRIPLSSTSARLTPV